MRDTIHFKWSGVDQCSSNRRGADFPRRAGGGIGELLKGLTKLCSFSGTVVGFDLVVSDNKLRLALIA